MESLDIILWTIGGGFSVLFSLMIVVWNSLSGRVEWLEKSLSQKIEKLDEKLTDVDRRLCRLEGAFASKDCCMIKDDRQSRKAE